MTRGINGSRMLVKDEVFFCKGKPVMKILNWISSNLRTARVYSNDFIHTPLYKIDFLEVKTHETSDCTSSCDVILSNDSRFNQIQDDSISMNLEYSNFWANMTHNNDIIYDVIINRKSNSYYWFLVG